MDKISLLGSLIVWNGYFVPGPLITSNRSIYVCLQRGGGGGEIFSVWLCVHDGVMVSD